MSQVQCRPTEVLPVGDAIVRLIKVQYSLLATPPEVVVDRLVRESEALIQALNALTINLGFECVLPDTSKLIEEAEEAPAPTSIEIIKRGAETSCCRITEASIKKSSRSKV
jgi:hypothetical protein